MERLGETVTREASTDKFLQAVENDYKEEVRVYEATMFSGTPMSTGNLMEMIRRSSKSITDKNQYDSALRCEFCQRTNHNEKNCWIKNPSLKKLHERTRSMTTRNKSRTGNLRTYKEKEKKISCYTCGKTGHIARNCWNNKNEASENAFLGFVATNKNEDQKEVEYVDSGASKHAASKREDFIPGSLQKIEGQGVRQADGTLLKATHVGTRAIQHKNGRTLTLHEVYLVPKLSIKLISVTALTKSGYTVIFSQNEGKIRNKRQEILPLTRSDRAWIFPSTQKTEEAYLTTMDATILHNKLGHPGGRKLEQAAKRKGIKLTGEIPLLENCEACLLSKPMRSPIVSTSTPSGEITVQVDGLPWKGGLNGQQGVITFTHRKNKVTKVYNYKQKSEAPIILEHYLSQVSPQLNPRVTCIQTDPGTEFISKEWRKVCTRYGVRSRTCPTDTPQLNGQVEKEQATLTAMTRANLTHAQAPKQYWPLALQAASYQKNRIPHDGIGGDIPIERATNKKVTLKNLRVWGCAAYVQINPKDRKGKSQDVRWKGIFVGYSPHSPEWLILDTRSNKIRTSSNVRFAEDVSGFQPTIRNRLTPDTYNAGSWEAEINCNDDLEDETNSAEEHENEQKDVNQPGTNDFLRKWIQGDYTSQKGENRNTEDSDDEEVNITQNELEKITKGDSPKTKHNCKSGQSHGVGRDQLGMINTLTDEDIPRNAREALSSETWRQSMEDEFDAHIKNKTWDLIEWKPEMNLTGSTWTFKVKRDENGTPIKYESRLCAQGYSQIPGIDYDTTYAPVVDVNTIRLLLCFAANQSLTIYQADIPTAYLNAELNDKVYMKQPVGFIMPPTKKNEMVCSLNKAIYGLKQSGRRWWSLLHKFIIEMGYTQFSVDPCLYHLKSGHDKSFIAIYVDDILLVSSSNKMRNNTLRLLEEKFNAKIIGLATWIRSLHITQSSNRVTMDQTTYIDTMLRRYGMASCNSAHTPMATSASVQSDKDHILSETDHALYRSIVGSLMYVATCTRPDICFAVGELGRFTHRPIQAHLNAAKRILRYLQGTRSLRITYQPGLGIDKAPKLIGYADADFASDVDTRKSISGQVFMYGGSPVAWRSKRQSVTATSTTEAEYIALSECSKTSMTLGNIVKELTDTDPFPIEICEDNRAASLIARNESSIRRTKHIDVKYHHIKDLVDSNRILITDISSENQLADIFTKPLPRDKHQTFTYHLLTENPD